MKIPFFFAISPDNKVVYLIEERTETNAVIALSLMYGLTPDEIKDWLIVSSLDCEGTIIRIEFGESIY